MKVITWNIQRRKNDLAWKYILKINPDIICLQESRNPEDYFKSKGYKDFFSPTNNDWGNYFAYKLPQFSVNPIIFENEQFKGRLQNFVVKTASNTILKIANIHVPITKGFSRFNLQNIIKKIFDNKETKNVIICGDFNFGPSFDTGGSKDHEKFFNNLLDKYKLFSCIYEPTFRKKGTKEYQDDFILVSNNLKNKHITKVDHSNSIMKLSDHYPIISNFTIL